MTTQRNINTQALPCPALTGASAARLCVLAVRAWLMSNGMQRSTAHVSGFLSALNSPKAGLNFINGHGGQTTRTFVAGAPSA